MSPVYHPGPPVDESQGRSRFEATAGNSLPAAIRRDAAVGAVPELPGVQLRADSVLARLWVIGAPRDVGLARTASPSADRLMATTSRLRR